MLFTWLPLNLPAPPDEFVNRAVAMSKNISYGNIENTALNQSDPSYLNRKLIKDNKEINSRIQYGYNLGEDWSQWVSDNLISDFFATGGRLSVGKDTTTHGAHVDSYHNDLPVYKLYYLIDPGGPDASTLFFKEHGYPIIRKGTKENVCCCNDYSKMEIIDQVKFPVGQWVLLNTNILHGVENVVGSRINLAVLTTADITQTLSKFFK